MCDAAQAGADSKSHILGAGWRICGPVLQPHAVVAIMSFDSFEQSAEHTVRLELIDQDGQPVVVATPQGPMMMRNEGVVVVQPVPDVPHGMDVDVPFVAEVGPGLPLKPGGRYVWQLWIDGETKDDWRVSFYVREHLPG